MFGEAPFAAASFAEEIGVSTSFSVTGLAATVSVGVLSFTLSSTVFLEGLAITTGTSSVRIWGLILPGQDPSYTEVLPSNTPSYSVITPTQAPTYEIITPNASSGWVEIIPTNEADYSEI